MRAEIISIGNEILNGSTVNTNATFISQRLHEIGIITYWVQSIGDHAENIKEALDIALNRSDIILVTGGLGPTHDDITKKVVADYFHSGLVYHEEIFAEIQERFGKRGIPIPEINRTQAYIPEAARMLPNPMGTARGLLFTKGDRLVFLMPGVPMEMQAIMVESVVPVLKEKCPTCRVKVDLFRTTGIAESTIYEKIREEMPKFSSYEIAFLPNFRGVDLRIVRKGADIVFKNLLEKTISVFIYTTEQREMESVVGEILKSRGMTISVAESLTGGLVQDRLTNVPGSSEYFMGGVVSYSNEAKMKFLGVKEESLKSEGAVSDIVAREMAQGVLKAFGTDIAVSTTGIAGPTGATSAKPVGLVYVGLAAPSRVIAKKFQLSKDRHVNKERAAQAALELVRRWLLKLPV
ncbi:MAG: competence/damage-inducible protein A [Calditrichia bacterium]